jgi:hypothetical protein
MQAQAAKLAEWTGLGARVAGITFAWLPAKAGRSLSRIRPLVSSSTYSRSYAWTFPTSR